MEWIEGPKSKRIEIFIPISVPTLNVLSAQPKVGYKPNVLLESAAESR